ncbi:uncharacterized protein (DUF433 family) [Rhodobium orientis]|uniref:DUF433 domain-containing protein n=1 Tax=Rhodobium orientis TaxID=34017 RepID=A0A327JLY2_9HYPH|nr:DUF433 domain-containing protein [Rhodobium orientis]MBB4304894.1 uncharacterized protein (DUF433 family) [Rhodobium orientis]MBK5949223.1 hypothetical protein [Rhodobium orientis]RAI27389.1 hypothetical protein CH339_10665 [Rhodobium orientis]
MDSYVFTPNEVAFLAGVDRRSVEKAIELDVLPARKVAEPVRGTSVQHLPAAAVPFLAALDGLVDVSLSTARKKALWRTLRARKGEALAPVEIVPGLTLDLEALAGERSRHAAEYLAARDAFLMADADILGGTPVIRGTRIPVYAVAGRLDGGETLEDLIEDYPQVPREAFEAAAIYARTHPQRGRPAAAKPWRKAG